jgi:hypothetical protein
MSAHTWYETCVVQDGEVRDVIARANKEGASMAVDAFAVSWPAFEMIFVRHHFGVDGKFRVEHKMTRKGVSNAA